jgi:hypothetical protein
MSCADNRLLHSALLDGELAPAERAQVEAHLATCVECTAELAALARTLGMLHALPAVRAPLGFVDRVLEATRPMPWHRRLGRRLFQPLRVKLPLEAAAVMLVALGAVYVFQNTPELQQAARQEQPAPVPVAPPATPEPATVPAVTGTPAPSPSAPAEAHKSAAEVDQTEKKKEGEGFLFDAPAKAKPESKKDGPPAPAAKPLGRADSRGAPSAGANLMKDAAPAASGGHPGSGDCPARDRVSAAGHRPTPDRCRAPGRRAARGACARRA